MNGSHKKLDVICWASFLVSVTQIEKVVCVTGFERMEILIGEIIFSCN